MSILDFNMPGMDTPEGQGLMAAAMSLLQAQKMPGQRGMFANALGQAGQQYMQTRTSAQDMAERRKFQDLQMRMQQDQLAEMQAQRARAEQARQLFGRHVVPGAPASAGMPANEMDSGMDMGAQPARPAGFDLPGYAMALGSVDPGQAINLLSSLQKEDKPQVVSPGQAVVKGGRVVYQAPDKPEVKDTSALREYQFAVSQGYKGTFADWDMARKKAGATNVTLPKIELKTGEGIAAQVGPMLRESRERASSGLKLVDSANRILNAAERGNLYVGPLANVQLKAAQWGEKFGFTGKDTTERIQNTRSVIRGMAEQAVAARSTLGGQAQISNSEQELLNKATSGDIGELTHAEVVQIAQLNDRLGRQLYEGHQGQLEAMGSDPNLRGLTKFYTVPSLPAARQSAQPGGAAGVPKPGNAKALSPEDAQAMEWARNNPNDPRAKQIMQRLGG